MIYIFMMMYYSAYLVLTAMAAAPADDTGAATAAASTAVPPQPASALHSDIAEILPSLPLETRCPPFHLRCYKGFWISEKIMERIPGIHTHFEPRPDDIFLASFPKSGTTWLKALAFATLNRAVYSPFDADHPLYRYNPHDCVEFLETVHDTKDGLKVFHSSGLFATHLPYSLLPECITGEGSKSRIVYICREPKDVLISAWLFTKKTSASLGLDVQAYTLQEAFDLFCEGRCINGPHWQHVLEYWEASVRRPDKVLCLRYEDMLCEPVSNLRKLAKFMGCEFSREEEDGGLADAIVELCGFLKLKSMEVNKNGSNYVAVKNENYFRNGVIGDWSNHLTPEMAKKLDKIVEDALQGSGLTFTRDGKKA